MLLKTHKKEIAEFPFLVYFIIPSVNNFAVGLLSFHRIDNLQHTCLVTIHYFFQMNVSVYNTWSYTIRCFNQTTAAEITLKEYYALHFRVFVKGHSM